jgi:hypothetical protein
MPLIERLMRWPSEPNSRWIHVHAFYAAGHELVAGNLTAAQIKTGFAMTPADATEFDALAATAPTGSAALAVANKALFVSRVHAVLMLAEDRFPGYDTPAGVRAKLGI